MAAIKAPAPPPRRRGHQQGRVHPPYVPPHTPEEEVLDMNSLDIMGGSCDRDRDDLLERSNIAVMGSRSFRNISFVDPPVMQPGQVAGFRDGVLQDIQMDTSTFLEESVSSSRSVTGKSDDFSTMTIGMRSLQNLSSMGNRSREDASLMVSPRGAHRLVRTSTADIELSMTSGTGLKSEILDQSSEISQTTTLANNYSFSARNISQDDESNPCTPTDKTDRFSSRFTPHLTSEMSNVTLGVQRQGSSNSERELSSMGSRSPIVSIRFDDQQQNLKRTSASGPPKQWNAPNGMKRTRSAVGPPARAIPVNRVQDLLAQAESTSSSYHGALVKQTHKNDFPQAQLVGRLLAYALHTFLPCQLSVNISLLTPEKFLMLHEVITTTPLIAHLMDTSQGFFTEETLMEVFVSLKAGLHAVLESPSEETTMWCSMDSSAAGKPGNEDRVIVVPNLYGYYGVETIVSPPPFFACVCDGHGGSDTAATVRDLFPAILVTESLQPGINLKQAFRGAVAQMQSDLEKDFEITNSQSGTTLSACIVASGILTVANLGDSHVIVVKKNGACRRVTEHHHVEVQKERDDIIANGGEVYEVGGVLRVGGRCRVTRNLGLIGCPVFHTPHVSSHFLEADDYAVVLATDGLWDVLSDAQVATHLMHALGKEVVERECSLREKNVSMGSLLDGNIIESSMASSFSSSTTTSSHRQPVPVPLRNREPARRAASYLIDEAVSAGTKDNVGVVILKLCER